jgi:hypothetical protein
MFLKETQIMHDKLFNVTVYNGLTEQTDARYRRNILYLKSIVTPIFDPMIPSTFTIQGQFSNLNFNEIDLIGCLRPPTGDIMLIGCNYGQLTNASYKPPVLLTKSGRGRKPVTKPKTKRKSQGSGLFFSSQITFNVLDGPKTYKIKIFRTGVFQLPYSNKMTLEGLLKPLTVISNYLSAELAEDVQLSHMMTTMRNYKTKLLNNTTHVNLDALYRILLSEKQPIHIQPYITWLFSDMTPAQYLKFVPYIGKTNIMNMGEIIFNQDRCFSLNIKFYRPLPNKIEKKMTLKCLQRGKVNLDGCNNEYESIELYYYLQYIYSKYRDEILIDVPSIVNEYNADDMNALNPETFLYA